MQPVYKLLDKLKDSDVPVLVRGESGTGKELVARALHFESRRAGEPFVSESCAAIPETLLESVLFGHEPGSFTGATDRRAGLFEQAGAGTLFLDEIGELTASCQAKLLRVLQARVVRRLGGRDEVEVRARVVCATHRDLEKMVKEGRFREDLYYRLNVVAIRLPPLRERREDIPLLVAKLLEKNASGAPPRITPAAHRALVDHAWPGNVRELENEVRRLLALQGDPIDVADLSPSIAQSRAAPAATAKLPPSTLEEAERRAILAALDAAGGSKGKAAEILGIARGSLWHKMKHHKIAEGESSVEKVD
jgi:DNA-binding NtrC family response regulator